MAGRGGVVTSAGFVFAATMAAMMGSKLIILAQMGSTIALRLLADTLIVPSLLMPSIATLLGRWFWWPQIVYPAVTITSGNRNLNVRQATTRTRRNCRTGAERTAERPHDDLATSILYNAAMTCDVASALRSGRSLSVSCSG